MEIPCLPTSNVPTNPLCFALCFSMEHLIKVWKPNFPQKNFLINVDHGDNTTTTTKKHHLQGMQHYGAVSFWIGLDCMDEIDHRVGWGKEHLTMLKRRTRKLDRYHLVSDSGFLNQPFWGEGFCSEDRVRKYILPGGCISWLNLQSKNWWCNSFQPLKGFPWSRNKMVKIGHSFASFAGYFCLNLAILAFKISLTYGL